MRRCFRKIVRKSVRFVTFFNTQFIEVIVQGGLTGISKCLELQNLIINEKLDILCLSETNLKSDIDTNTLDLPINF